MIEKIIHHYRYNEDGLNSIKLSHYLSIKSTLLTHPNYKIIIHVNRLFIESSWYHLLRYEFPELVWRVDLDSYDGAKFDIINHYIDKMRINDLVYEGGLSMDTDIILLKSFEDFFEEYQCVSEMEHDPEYLNPIGIGIGFLMSQSQGEFITLYSEVNSKYEKGKEWSTYSVEAAYEIYKKNPKLITVFPPILLEPFLPRPSHNRDLFMHNHNINPLCRAIHLSESVNYDRYLKHMTVEHIMTVDTTFTKCVRHLIGNNIWDNENRRSLITIY